jgi:hypothetical protein
VLRLLRWWWLLGLCLLGDEIGGDLGLDVLLWAKLKVEFANSTDNLMTRPTMSRLRKISLRGKLEMTLILCDWK